MALALSNHVYEQKAKDLERALEETYLELSKVRLELEKLKASEKDVTDQLCNCHADAFKAADILKAALKLPSNKGGAIKRQMEEAIKLIDDV